MAVLTLAGGRDAFGPGEPRGRGPPPAPGACRPAGPGGRSAGLGCRRPRRRTAIGRICRHAAWLSPAGWVPTSDRACHRRGLPRAAARTPAGMAAGPAVDADGRASAAGASTARCPRGAHPAGSRTADEALRLGLVRGGRPGRPAVGGAGPAGHAGDRGPAGGGSARPGRSGRRFTGARDFFPPQPRTASWLVSASYGGRSPQGTPPVPGISTGRPAPGQLSTGSSPGCPQAAVPAAPAALTRAPAS